MIQIARQKDKNRATNKENDYDHGLQQRAKEDQEATIAWGDGRYDDASVDLNPCILNT